MVLLLSKSLTGSHLQCLLFSLQGLNVSMSICSNVISFLVSQDLRKAFLILINAFIFIGVVSFIGGSRSAFH